MNDTCYTVERRVNYERGVSLDFGPTLISHKPWIGYKTYKKLTAMK